jgi:hypothetical protein
MLLSTYWLFFPEKVITFTQPVTTDKLIYHRGETISYFITYCKTRTMVGTIYRSLVNETITTFTPVTNNLPAGCRTTKKSDLSIPDNADLGTYHLESTIEYKVNPLRDFATSWRSNDFLIVK